MQNLKPTGLPPESCRSFSMNCTISMGVENALWRAGEMQSCPTGTSRAAAISGVTFGPVQNAPQLARVEALVQDARTQGARIVCGGQRLDRPGYFYAPTIVAGLSNGARLVDEEQFGPVLPVIAYRTVDEAVALANASSMGLGGSVWGDVQAATALAPRLECGTVWVNGHAEVLPHCPFGGSKMSGVGVEFGLDGLLEYTQPQLLNING